jgi:hypothetical protein
MAYWTRVHLQVLLRIIITRAQALGFDPEEFWLSSEVA